MTNLTIQLDPVAVREATAQAILGLLTPEMRSQMIEKAISAMLKPSTDSWDKNKSPLELSFERAVGQVASDVVLEHVKSDQAVVETLKTLARRAADKMLNCDQDKLVQRMTDAFVSSLRSDR